MNDFIVTLKNEKRDVRISENSEIFLDGKSHHYELVKLNNSTYRIRIDEKFYDISHTKIDGENVIVSLSGCSFDLQVRTALQEKASKVMEQKGLSHHLKEVKAPMPGMLLKIKKTTGEKVEAGESVMILEAMKMENDIKSPSSGIIKEIFAKENTAVEKGIKLFSIE